MQEGRDWVLKLKGRGKCYGDGGFRGKGTIVKVFGGRCFVREIYLVLIL